LIGGIANQTAWIYPLAAAIPSAKVVVDGLKHTKADVLAIPPPVVVDLVRQPDLAEYVSKNIDTLVYGGGDLSEAIGSVLTNKLKLVSVYGASEIGLPPAIRRSGTFPSEDWQYVHFHPEIGVEFRHVNENLFELCIVRHSDLEEHQPVFKLFPDLQVYRTRDLYTPHPSKPDLWIYKGRADDIIVFLTGEKPIQRHLSITSLLNLESKQLWL
jgi:acyl-coenzyme A synthetase/AMP-(fatty) acid ligase